MCLRVGARRHICDLLKAKSLRADVYFLSVRFRAGRRALSDFFKREKRILLVAFSRPTTFGSVAQAAICSKMMVRFGPEVLRGKFFGEGRQSFSPLARRESLRSLRERYIYFTASVKWCFVRSADGGAPRQQQT